MHTRIQTPLTEVPARQCTNYLKDHLFRLSSLPTPDEYAKIKAQRQVFLVEEIHRTELEHLKQQKKINFNSE